MDNQRYGLLFNTATGKNLYYDAGTGKVLEIDFQEKELIEKILNNDITVEEAGVVDNNFRNVVNEERLFSKEVWDFIVPTFEDFQKSIKGRCEQIVLELTEDCNLRCGYCIYNEHHPNHRIFSKREMNFSVAKRSIDYFLRGFKNDEFALTFYGGEPLLNFKLMKDCIEYTKESYPNIKFSYGFTSNLTLLTDYMIDYFKTLENIDIVCSLDGPQKFHDKFRKTLYDKGSYKVATRNFLKLVKDFYSVEEKRGISINCVLTPPYTTDKLDEIYDYFYNELKIPKQINCNYSYVDSGNMRFEYDENEIKVDDSVSPLEKWAVNDYLYNEEETKYFDMIDMELFKIANRPYSQNGFISESYMHGNCLPGQRRVYVTVNGDFKPCEKVGNVPILGNCYTGYDYINSYNTYILQYRNYYRDMCNGCWARTLCTVCYENTMDNLDGNLFNSRDVCMTSRDLLKDMFINYYSIFEVDKKRLENSLSKIELR